MIEQKYKAADIYTRPTVNVAQQTAGADPTQYISVLGEVKLPQNVPFRPGMTMVDAIAACGGFTDFAKPKKVKLVSGGQSRILDLSNLGSAGAVTKLKVGDSINVSD